MLDRAGVRPADFDPDEEKNDELQEFNPRDFSPEELNLIEAAFRLMVEKKKEKRQRAMGLGFIHPDRATED